MNRWVEYLGVKVAASEADEHYHESRLRHLEAVITINNRGEKNVTTARAQCHLDPEWITAQEEYEHAYAYRKMLTRAYEGVDGKASLLSRELTRRVGTAPRDHRVGKWST